MEFASQKIQQSEAKVERPKMRRLVEALCNFLDCWLNRLSFIPDYNFITCSFSSKSELNQPSTDKLKDPAEEYVEDIYSFYMLFEEENRQCNYTSSGSNITPRVRASVVNLIIEVHQMLRLSAETLYLSVTIFDRFLSQETVKTVEAKLVGMCAMLIASKYEELHTPQVEDLTDIWQLRYSTNDVLGMEKRILNRLEWSVSLPTPYMFLLRYINIEGVDKETENMVYFFSELALMEHSLIEFYPSLIAASCVYAARCTLKKNPLWTETLQHFTRCSESQLLECTQILVNAHSKAPKSRMNAVYKKYSLERSKKVALFAPADLGQLAWNNWSGI